MKLALIKKKKKKLENSHCCDRCAVTSLSSQPRRSALSDQFHSSYRGMSPCKAIAESRSSSACRKTRRRLPPLSHWRLGTKCSGGVSGGVEGRRGKYFCIVHHASVIAYKLVGYTEAAGGRVGRGEEDKSLQKKIRERNTN